VSSPPRDGVGEARPAPGRPVEETYHGVRVVDPYRWLEDAGDAEVRAWTAAQNARTRAHLDTWPGRGELRARLTQLMTAGSPVYVGLREAGGTVFAVKRQPPLEQPFLVALASADDLASERVVFDPNALDPSGGASIDWFEPSFDGRHVAVSLSRSGTESGDVHVIDSATGRDLGGVVRRVNGGTAGGSLAWDADGSGFYYTRYPRPGERPDAELDFWVQVHRHRLGTSDTTDVYEIGREFPRIAEIQLETTPGSPVVLASVQKGDGGEFTHWLRDGTGSWHALTRYEDRCVAARLGERGDVWFVSLDGAPRGRVLRLALEEAPHGIAAAREVIPETTDAIQASFARGSGLWIGRDQVYVLYQKGGPNVAARFRPDGTPDGHLDAPPMSSVDDVVPLDEGGALYLAQSATVAPAWWRAPKTAGPASRTALVEVSPADFSACEVVRDEAVSRDGTPVPITILRPRGLKLDGTHPAILYGYGGYGICQTPVFRARLAAWTERGGIFAVAHVRGGGEFGDAWHRAGALDRKQNVFDDFAACAKRLVESGTTSHERLALLGGSNGGLLMGAMIVQHPGLARAVVSLVGLYDMLRVEKTPNGAFNVPEFGSVDDPAMFAALHAYSPYHRVEDGRPYPAVLLATGENDPRVEPWQSRKMAARLQAASTSGRPVLLRTSAAAGHGMSNTLSHQVDEFTDILTFLFQEIGSGRFS
jgi:prolyl oligopeptidase